jgi:hypothetical protein
MSKFTELVQRNISDINQVSLYGATQIGNYAFRDTMLEKITIPNSVESIGSYAFYNCTSLTSITIPDGVTSIGYAAFSYCENLTSITFIGTSQLTSIGDNAFSNCSSLTSITIPDGVTSIGHWAFRDCSSLTSITIPDGVTSIGYAAFRYCSSLTSITFIGTSQLTSIGDDVFYNCTSLTSITIPDGVTSIGHWAFSGCTGLTDCTILRTSGVISLSSNNFNQTNNKIYVPYSLLSSYKTATNWIGISDKIMGYQTFTSGETLPRYNTTHTFTWYPSKADLISKTNGIVANGTATATSAGEWYCDKPGTQVTIVTDLISSAKTTSFIRPTSSSNANQTGYIYFDTVASTTQYPIVIDCSVTSYQDASGTTNNYTNQSINYGSTIEFDNTKSSTSSYKLTVRFDTTERVYVQMYGYYNLITSEYWQQITINSIKQTTSEYQN